MCHPAPSLPHAPVVPAECSAPAREPARPALPSTLAEVPPRAQAAADTRASWSGEAKRLIARYHAEEDDGSREPLSDVLRATIRRLTRLLEASGALARDEADPPALPMTWALIPGQALQPAASGYFSTYYAVPHTSVAPRAPARAPSAAVEELELHVATSRTPVESAQARYALARALWSSSGDLDRALFLARQAKQTLQTSAVDLALLDEINAWLIEKEELRSSGRFSTHVLDR